MVQHITFSCNNLVHPVPKIRLEHLQRNYKGSWEQILTTHKSQTLI